MCLTERYNESSTIIKTNHIEVEIYKRNWLNGILCGSNMEQIFNFLCIAQMDCIEIGLHSLKSFLFRRMKMVENFRYLRSRSHKCIGMFSRVQRNNFEQTFYLANKIDDVGPLNTYIYSIVNDWRNKQTNNGSIRNILFPNHVCELLEWVEFHWTFFKFFYANYSSSHFSSLLLSCSIFIWLFELAFFGNEKSTKILRSNY